MRRWPISVLVGVIFVGSVLWFSDLVVSESRITHSLVGGVGLFAAVVSLLSIGRGRGWFTR